MNYREMIVWSEGSEGAASTKKCIVLSIFTIIIDIILVITFFTCNMHDDTTIPMTLLEHIGYGLFGLILFGWITPLSLFSIKDNLEYIKLNKLIPIQIYDINEFIKIDTLSEDEFVVFSDECGAILGLKKYEKESKRFCDGTKFFYQFKEYYEKHTGEKREVSCNLAPIEEKPMFTWEAKEDDELYNNGITVVVAVGRSKAIKKFVEALSYKIGYKCDFAFAAGRAHIDVSEEGYEKCVEALKDDEFISQFVVPYSKEAYDDETYFEIAQITKVKRNHNTINVKRFVRESIFKLNDEELNKLDVKYVSILYGSDNYRCDVKYINELRKFVRADYPNIRDKDIDVWFISADESIIHARHTMLNISIPIEDYMKFKSEDKIHIL